MPHPFLRSQTRIRAGLVVLAILAVLSVALSTLGPLHEDGLVPSTSAPALISSTSPSQPESGASSTPSILLPIPEPTWVNVTSTAGAPPSVAGSVSVYDPASNETVLFGGVNLADDYTNNTWVFANGTWANITNFADAPPARGFAAADFDAHMNGVLLFGGDGNAGILNDTWLFSDGIWTDLTYVSPVQPPGRYGAVMAYDPEPEENGSVLFGGYGGCGYCSDTWSWESWAGWVELQPNAPPPGLYTPAMAYDPLSGYIVLFGGYTEEGVYSSATWELYSGQWWPVYPATSPVGHDYSSLVYYPGAGVLLFGGQIDGGYVNTTWIFSNGVWTKQAPANAPPPCAAYGLTLDGTGSTPLVIDGGNSTIGFTFTWAYELPLSVGLEENTNATEAGSNVTFSIVDTTAGIFHFLTGTPPYQAVVSFGDGSDALVSGSNGTFTVTHAYAHAGSYNPSVTLTDAVGDVTNATGPAVTVVAGPAVVASASPTTTDVGVPVLFTGLVVSTGEPPLNLTWSFGDGTNGTGRNVTHTFTTAGTYLVSVQGVDADDASASSTVSIVVNPDPTVAVGASTISATTGTNISFYANVSGGTGPFSYSWRFADGDQSSLPWPQHAYPSTGSRTVEVWANDSRGESAQGSVTVTIGSSSSPSSTLAGVPWWFWAGVAGLVLVGVVGTLLLVRRTRLKS